MSDKTLSPIYASAPSGAFPPFGTKPFILLMELINGEPVLKTALFDIFSDGLRSPLQQLEGDSFENWLIHRIKDDRNVIIGFQLDSRHLSGDPKIDAAARRERKKEFKKDSLREARLGKKREPKALCEFLEAKQEFFEALGEAANDSSIDQPEKA
jgi:hypothetical protein